MSRTPLDRSKFAATVAQTDEFEAFLHLAGVSLGEEELAARSTSHAVSL